MELIKIVNFYIVDITHNNNSVLLFEVTAQHLVFVERSNQHYSIPASDIVVGDSLNGNIVESIHTVHRNGVYAPLTQSGDFFVNDNIIVSNYINILQYSYMRDQHILGHALFVPQRLLCKYFIDTCKKETYINGYGSLAYIIVKIGSYFNKNQGGWFTNTIVSSICIPLVGLFSKMESITMLRLIFVVATFVAIGRRIMKFYERRTKQ